MMEKLSLAPTSLAQWHALVQEAERKNGQPLDDELESYLILLLQHFIDKPEIAETTFALDYLMQRYQNNSQQQQELREIGDRCLLFSGLFPERATRRHVTVSYYVRLGQRAYHDLALLAKQTNAALFNSLEIHFVLLMDTLQYMRELDGEAMPLSPLQAEDLWRMTGSHHAQVVLQRYTRGWISLGDQSGGIH